MIRLDGDLYESTINSLENLYPNRSIGGYATVDDYGVSPHCEKAVDDFRERLGIRDEMRQIDWSGVFWAEDGMSAKGRAAR